MADGAIVTIASRDATGIQTALKELGSSVASATVDLVDNKTILVMFEKLGSFDHLVVTAASTKTGPVRSLELEDAYASMDSKFWGAYRLAKAAKLNDGGSMTFISGFLSHRPSPKAVLQGAINAAIEGMVRGLALELLRSSKLQSHQDSSTRPFTQRCRPMPRQTCSLRPRTSFQCTASVPANDVVQAILMVAANPYITGSTVVVDGGGTIAV